MNWHLNPIFESYAVVAAVALLLFLLLLVPAFGSLSRRQRLVLTGLRVGVVLLLLLLMLRPTCTTTTSQSQLRTVLLLLDRSRSMQLPNASDQQTRWQAQQELLEQIRPLLLQDREAVEIKLYAFDNKLAPIVAGGWDQLQPDGDQTDLGGVTDEAVRLQQGQRLAAMFLVSDGVQTAYSSRVDVHAAARQLARLGVPLLPVALGPAGDATQARDVALENLPDQLTGFVRNDLLVRGAVRVRGYVNQPIDVELTLEDAAGNQRSLGRTQVVARQDGQLAPVQMLFTPEQVGDYKLNMTVSSQDGEMVTANNSLPCYVKVREGLRVAYLYGTRLGEQRALRWSLSMGNGVQLVHRFIDVRSRKSWPQSHADLLADGKYDAFLLESVPAAALETADLQALADQVSAGKGLMMIGGYYSFGPGGYQDTPLAAVLPVTMGRFERQDVGLDKPISRDLHLEPREGLQMLPVGYHPILRLAPAESNRQAWEVLPRLQGANKLSPAERSQVLAISQSGSPLLIAGQYGNGRVLAFAGDSTVRWWTRGLQEQHKRFWRQAVLWLVGRDDPQQNEVWLQLDQRRFSPGARMTFTAGARDASNEDIQDAEFTAELVLPDKQVRPLPLRRDGATVAAETDTLDAAGDYVVRISAQRQGQPLGSAEGTFQVIDRDVELSTAAADHDQLARLAMLTSAAGGRLLVPEQLRPALEEVLSQPPVVEIDAQTSWELAANGWDAWLLLLLLTALLGCEWALRKTWGLV